MVELLTSLATSDNINRWRIFACSKHGFLTLGYNLVTSIELKSKTIGSGISHQLVHFCNRSVVGHHVTFMKVWCVMWTEGKGTWDQDRRSSWPPLSFLGAAKSSRSTFLGSWPAARISVWRLPRTLIRLPICCLIASMVTSDPMIATISNN